MTRTLGLSQFVIIIAIAVALIFAWDFGRRIVETVQMVQALQAADRQLAQAEQANTRLTALKQDVTDDEWLEKQARARLHYTRATKRFLSPPRHRRRPSRRRPSLSRRLPNARFGMIFSMPCSGQPNIEK